jgi:hypothetical protein
MQAKAGSVKWWVERLGFRALKAFVRHCERSEAIQQRQSKGWIASSLRFSQ